MWNAIRFPPPYQGAILSGRVDGAAYLLGWFATLARITLWVVVLVLGLHSPWKLISTISSTVATLFLVGVGRLVWLPVRIPEAARAVVSG